MKAVLIVISPAKTSSVRAWRRQVGDASATGSGFRRPGELVACKNLVSLSHCGSNVFGVYGCSKAGLGIAFRGATTIQKRTVVQFR